MPNIKVTAFRWVPEFAQGQVRDLRVRWALEEAGLPYEEQLIDLEESKSEAYRQLQPFGQVPAYREDGLELFESGAIVMHIAERSDALMPPDLQGQARTRAWMFAALNSVEPEVQNLAGIDLFHGDSEWAAQYRPIAEEAAKRRLTALSDWLDSRDYLEEGFSAGDLLMTTVLQILRHTDMVKAIPVLEDYRLRCEERPAYQKAVADQMAPFHENAPT